ncbi:MAG: hypothetical protein QXQ77_01855 [Candidatus Aenigmatarchaeota archaeon]
MRKIVFCIFSIFIFFFLTTSLNAKNRVSYVTFRFAYHLGENKSNDFYVIGEINGNVEENVHLIGYPTNLSHLYVCTYEEEEFEKKMFASLIHSGKREDLNFISFSSENQEDYKIEVKQKVEGTNLILTFTNGTCEQIKNKIYSVEKYGLPSQAFSLYSKDSSLISLVFRNDKILIKGSETFSPGINRICIEHCGTTKENKPIIEVRRC